MRIFLGVPRNRMGIVFEGWEQPDPEKRHFVQRLPAKAVWEVTRLFGMSIGHWALILQRVDKPRERAQ